MSSAGLTFVASGWTIALAATAVIVTISLSVVAWRRSGRQRAMGLLESLRIALMALAAVLINQPEWTEQYRPQQKPTVAVLWDESRSMLTRDVIDPQRPSQPPQSRAACVAPFTSASAWQALAEKYEVVLQPFAGTSTNAKGNAAIGNGTNINEPLLAALNNLPRLRGVVLATDGDWNEGPAPAEAATRLRLKGVPVLAVPVGRADRLPDIALASLDAPTFGVVGKSVRIPFTIESALPREYVTSVTLRSSDGDEVTKQVSIAPQGRTSDAIIWEPKQVGDYTVTLAAPPQAEETILDNNKLTAPISIREEKLRVLVVESYPRWEYRYLRNALSRDPGVEAACLLFHPGLSKAGGGNADYIKEFPSTLDELAKYDVVFLGDVGLEDSLLTIEQCRLLKGLVEQQASGLVFMPGMQGRQFSLMESELREIYPVVLDDSQPSGWGSRTPSQFELTELGRRSLLTKLADSQEDNVDVWDALPGFQWCAPVLRAKAGAEVLCVHNEASNQYGRLPLLVTQTYGSGKVLFMGTDGAWRWRKGVEDKYHYRFWGQVVRWMAYRRNMAKGETMRLYYSPDQPPVGHTLALQANVMDLAGEPLARGEVTARIVAPSGQGETVRFTSADEQWGAFASRYTTAEPGKHQVTLSCKQTGAQLETSFFVHGSAAEPAGRPARPEALEEIARITGGRVLPVHEMTRAVNYLAALPEPSPIVRRLQLWAHPLAAGAMIALLGAFWIGRKAAGLL